MKIKKQRRLFRKWLLTQTAGQLLGEPILAQWGTLDLESKKEWQACVWNKLVFEGFASLSPDGTYTLTKDVRMDLSLAEFLMMGTEADPGTLMKDEETGRTLKECLSVSEAPGQSVIAGLFQHLNPDAVSENISSSSPASL